MSVRMDTWIISGRELEMRIRPVILALALFCLAASAFAQQDIDKKKVLEELEMPKADMILNCTISTEKIKPDRVRML